MVDALGMTCWVDVQVAHEWPPILDDLAAALLLQLKKLATSRGTHLLDDSITKRFDSGTLPISDHEFIHVVYITVLAEEVP